MKLHRLLLFITFLLLTVTVVAQYTTVNFDYELATFNDNQPIPSETRLIISGNIPDSVQLVEIKVFRASGRAGRAPLFSGYWKRPYNKPKGDFRVPLNIELRASKKYDFRINYYEKISEAERQDLFNKLTDGLSAYLRQIVRVEDEEITLEKRPRTAINDLDDLVIIGLQNYRSEAGYIFPGFSDIIKEQLANLKGTDLEPLKTDSLRRSTAKELMGNLRQLVISEVQYLLNDEIVKRVDSRYVDDYETESKPGYFSVNVGYGAVYLGGNVENLDYGAAPFAGLGFPLSTSRIAPAFLRNSAITFGVFLQNFELDEQTTITGPVIKRPIKVGLDYKLFQFIRLNVGAALLEEVKTNGNGDKDQKIFVQPFIGISAKFNLRLSLDK